MRVGNPPSNLKVVRIAPTYFKYAIGGGERNSWETVRALSKYVNVTFIVFGKHRKTEKISETLTVEEYPSIKSLKFFNRIVNIYNPIPLTPLFLREIDNADIVHIHQFNTLVSAISILYSRFKHKIVCLTDHGGGAFKLTKFLPFVGRSVDLYLVTTRYSYLSRNFARYKKNHYVIYGGVDTSKFYPLDSKKENKVLFVGRILPIKGIDILIRAVQKLDADLYVAGTLRNSEKKYFEFLKSLDTNNKTIFKVNYSQEEIALHYNSALVTVLPSRTETMGLVLLESMACGTPVICTNIGGMPEIVENGKTGFVVPPNDPKALEEKIRYFLDNPDESKRMGMYARKIVLEKYTWDAVAIRCLEAYAELFEKKKNQ